MESPPTYPPVFSPTCSEVACDTHCIICHDDIEMVTIALPCKHNNFDFECLKLWFERSPTCPICNQEVIQVIYSSEPKSSSYKVYKMPQTAGHLWVPAPLQRGQTSPLRRTHNAPSAPEAPKAPLPAYYPPNPAYSDYALLRRKAVYRHRQYSLHVGMNSHSQIRDLTPEMFRLDKILVSRARRWIRRELQVFGVLSGCQGEPQDVNSAQARNMEALLAHIIAILKTIDTQGSEGQAVELLRDHLGRENAQLFFHELRAWLRSPYQELADWDETVQYRALPE